MTRDQLIHVIRAAAVATNETSFVVIGSQAILATHPDAPRSLRHSMEGDAYPVHSPEKSILIDGSIGENSLFHQTHGYYGHGVSPETATLPDGWKERTIPLQIDTERGIVAHCLEKHDLAYSKLAAGREKDFDFIGDLLKFRLINRGKIQRLINTAQDATLREKLTRNWTIATSKLERREGRGPKSPVTLSSLQSPRRTGGPGDSRPNTLGGR